MQPRPQILFDVVTKTVALLLGGEVITLTGPCSSRTNTMSAAMDECARRAVGSTFRTPHRRAKRKWGERAMPGKITGLTFAIHLLGTACAFAGSVRGIVVDNEGNPLSDVRVEVVYQTFNADQLMGYGESIKAETQTGEDGRYGIDTTHLPPGEYSAHAYQIVVNGGRETNVDAVGSDLSTFAGNADTIRNFVAGIVEQSDDMPYGNAGIFVVNNAIMDYTDLSGTEITLVNIETGAVYVKTVRPTGEGLAITGIPFGTYRASARLAGRPMQIALWGPGESDTFASSIEHDFTMGFSGNQIQVVVKP